MSRPFSARLFAIGFGVSVTYELGASLVPRTIRDHIDQIALPLLILFIATVIVLSIVVPGRTPRLIERTNALRQARKSVEDRLDELERLKRRDMVTPEEYAAKRQEILKEL